MNQIIIPDEIVMNKIYLIRGAKVMLDKDLAEFDNLIFQIGTSSWGGTRKLPSAFTEQGVAMLSSVLHSKRAILVNIQIIRVFTKMRRLLETHTEIFQKLDQIEYKDIEQDQQILLIFEYLRQLEQSRQQQDDQSNRKRIGFRQDD
jgi:hypothetical protein